MTSPANHEGLRQLREFLDQRFGPRIFEWPTSHPSRPTGFCPCDWAIGPRLWSYARATLLLAVVRGPFNRPKIAFLRRMGALIGDGVYISADTWIDPVFPQLLQVEDNVLIGQGVKIALHEFGRDRFRAGRVIIRQGAIIGGFALIGHGVEIGENAVVAGGAVVGRDVPAGTLAVGNPARMFTQSLAEPAAETGETLVSGAKR